MRILSEKLSNSGACLWVVVGVVATALGTVATAQEQVSYATWRTRCLKTPANRMLQGRFPTREQLPLPDSKVMADLTQQMLKAAQESDLAETKNWIGNKPASEFFDIRRSYFTRPPLPFQPFAQKIRVEPGSELIFHGDFHGDIRSFITTLDLLNQQGRLSGFKIKDPKTYMFFLGDYTDRGAYGVEVLYTLFRLKLANPDRVFMSRGNHEDFQLTAAYGFLRELEVKYGRGFSPVPIWRTFDFLPVVIYVGAGNDFVQCNHGGMEPGFEPGSLLNADGKTRFQLLGELKQKSFAARHADWLAKEGGAVKQLAAAKLLDFLPKSPTSPAPIGFMWNDYSLFADEPGLAFNESRLAFIHGMTSTRYLLRAASTSQAQLRAVFRAHQHSSVPTPMMERLVVSRGAFRHWQRTDNARASGAALKDLVETAPRRTIPEGSVWTFNVAPDSLYGVGNNYTFDTIGIVKTAGAFKDWRMQVVNVPVKLE